MSEAKFLWVDCEFTQLNDGDPSRDAIWEIAALATDADLRPMGTYETFVAHPIEAAHAVRDRQWWIDHPDDYARMLDALATGLAPAKVDAALVDFTTQLFRPKKAIIAGNSIGNDRRRIEFQFPGFHDLLSHQVLDVTSIRKWGEARTGQTFVRDEGERHKAMQDIGLSVAELVFWHNRLRDSEPFNLP